MRYEIISAADLHSAAGVSKISHPEQLVYLGVTSNFDHLEVHLTVHASSEGCWP